MSIQTLSELYLASIAHDKPDCLMHKVDGQFVPVSTRELYDNVRRIARALLEVGIQPGDRVALMAENGPHWPTVDFAALSVGAVLVPIYPTLTSDQAAYIVNDCGARIVFVEDRQRLDGLLGERADMPLVEYFAIIGGETPHEDIPTFDSLLKSNEPLSEEDFAARAKGAKPDDLATFIYTSGTTGNPKGVMLTHGNITSNVLGSIQMMDIEPEYTALSFLPLSHSFERTVDYIYFYRGATIAYAESVAAVAQNFQEVEPHVFVSVPRVYEKVLSKVQDAIAAGSPTKQKIFAWAVGVAKASLPYRLQQKSPPGLLGLKLKLADKLVFGKIKARLGGRFQFAMSGGAPLSSDLAEFFWGAGIEIYEGYGLSETSPVLTVNARGAVKLGTVGGAVPGVDLRIAEDGEILAKGPNIMRGYFNLEEATKEAIDSEGWFHTGDIGEIDAEGFLRITDRKKEIIVNAYGKNVAPAPIENALKASRFIGQAVVIGDKRKFLSALIVPDFEVLATWASREGLGSDMDAILKNSTVLEMIESEIKKVNGELAKYQKINAWDLVPSDFTIETGELTPTQKIKRRVIHEKYKDRIDGMYSKAKP